jgi:hypothetical protein
MMQRTQNQPISIEGMVNTVFNFSSIVSMPVEMQFHPFHGTRFYSPLVILMSTVMMLIVPTFFTFGDNDGLIGMGTIQKWFFVALAAHGIRKFRLILHPKKEINSYAANDHWFFFNWLPKASFWKIRIVYEPLFLVAASITLQNLFVITGGAGNFLIVSAVFLAMKNYTHWYMQWEFLRDPGDIRSVGPIIAERLDKQGMEESNELPKNVARVISDDGKA